MSLFFPFGLPVSSSYAQSSSFANVIEGTGSIVEYAETASVSAPGPTGPSATTCPPGYLLATESGSGGDLLIPDDPGGYGLDRASYLLCVEPTTTTTTTAEPSTTTTTSTTTSAPTTTTTTSTTTAAPTTTTTTSTTTAAPTTTTTTSTTTATPTTTTTTLQPATLDVYAKALFGNQVTIIYYKVNGGSQQFIYTSTLNTSCTKRGTITGLVDGDEVEFYTDETENLSGTDSASSCPTSVGASTSYTTTVSGGSNAVSLTIDTQAAELNVYARTFFGSETTIIYYTVNGGSQQTSYNGGLGVSCVQVDTITNIESGDVIRLYTDENERISGNDSTSCPSSVGTDTFYEITVGSGENDVALIVDTGAAQLNVSARTLVGSENTTIYYTVDGGSQQTSFSGTLNTTCVVRDNITGLVSGSSVVLYTDEDEELSGVDAGAACPTSVTGGNTTYQVDIDSGANNISLTIDTSTGLSVFCCDSNDGSVCAPGSTCSEILDTDTCGPYAETGQIECDPTTTSTTTTTTTSGCFCEKDPPDAIFGICSSECSNAGSSCTSSDNCS